MKKQRFSHIAVFVCILVCVGAIGWHMGSSHAKNAMDDREKQSYQYLALAGCSDSRLELSKLLWVLHQDNRTVFDERYLQLRDEAKQLQDCMQELRKRTDYEVRYPMAWAWLEDYCDQIIHVEQISPEGTAQIPFEAYFETLDPCMASTFEQVLAQLEAHLKAT